MDATSLTGQNALSSALQTQRAAMAATAGSTADQKKMKKASQDFEGFFVGQMMESMTSGIETDETFGGGHGEEMWRSMLNQEYGKEVAKSGRLGIGSTVMAGMLRAQEERTAASQGTQAIIGGAKAQTTDTVSDAAAQQSAAAAIAPSVRRALKGM